MFDIFAWMNTETITRSPNSFDRLIAAALRFTGVTCRYTRAEISDLPLRMFHVIFRTNPVWPFSMTAESHVSFCFLALGPTKNMNKNKTKHLTLLKGYIHPPSISFEPFALASLQAIRARVKCFFPFFSLSLRLPLLLQDWGQLAHD